MMISLRNIEQMSHDVDRKRGDAAKGVGRPFNTCTGRSAGTCLYVCCILAMILTFTSSLQADAYEVGFAALLGGGQWERIQAVCTDEEGSIYVTGSTKSVNLPSTPGVFDQRGSGTGQNDGFVAKIAPDGSGILWLTYLHGSDRDDIYGIEIGPDGYVYLTGWTRSRDFPTTRRVYDSSHNGKMDIIVAKLSPDGSRLVYSTLIGGSGTDQCRGAMYVHEDGAVSFSGYTDSRNFPTTIGAVQRQFQGGYGDACIARLSADGTSLEFSTYLGSSGPDHAFAGLAVHADGSLVVTGAAGAADFPVTANAFQTEFGGNAGHGVWNGDAFVARIGLTPDNQAVVHYVSFLGGSADEKSTAQHGLALDAQGNVYVSGTTHSADFPTTPGGFQQKLNGANNLYVSKISADGSRLLASTYLGGIVGNGYETSGMTIDSLGHLLISGSIFGGITHHPVSPGAFQPEAGGGSGEAFFLALSPDLSMIRYTSFLGGSDGDRIRDLAFLSSGDVVVAGDTHSPNFPTTARAFQADYISAGDAHVARLNRTDSIITVDPSISFEIDNTQAFEPLVAPDALGVAVYMDDPNPDPLAFVNPDGGHVVVIGSNISKDLVIRGLPAGNYGIMLRLIVSNDNAVLDAELPDQTILSGQGLAASIPTNAVLTIYAKAPSTDHVPPTAPADLIVNVTTQHNELSWTPSVDNENMSGYLVLRNGIYLGFTQIPSFADKESFSVSRQDTVYQIFAVDVAGNRSEPLIFESVVPEVTDLGMGLLGYWTFDGDHRTRITDNSGAGREGTLVGPTRTLGLSGNALDFDGVNDYVRIVNDPALNRLNALTMSAWIYPRQDKHGHVLDKGDGDKRLLLKGSDSRLMGLIRYTGQVCTSESIDNTITLNAWQQVALTWSRSDNRIRLYHNGREVSYAKQELGVGEARDDTSHPYMIGIRGALGSVHAFNGLIDEVRLYDRVLTGNELKALSGSIPSP